MSALLSGVHLVLAPVLRKVDAALTAARADSMRCSGSYRCKEAL